jgi:hypothetical protein
MGKRGAGSVSELPIARGPPKWPPRPGPALAHDSTCAAMDTRLLDTDLVRVRALASFSLSAFIDSLPASPSMSRSPRTERAHRLDSILKLADAEGSPSRQRLPA